MSRYLAPLLTNMASMAASSALAQSEIATGANITAFR